MRYITLTFFSLIMLLNNQAVNAQTNSIEVAAFLSPLNSTNYNSNATVDIEVRIENIGPNNITPGDSIFIDLSIANNDSTDYRLIKKPVNILITPNSYYDILLVENFTFLQDHSYVSCASVRGTKAYPTNTAKQSTSCVSFIVNISKIKTKVEKLFYANNKINFRFNQKVNAQLHVYDISGKEIFSSRVNQKAGELDFAAPASGFYLLRLVEENGNTTTSKFIVSNK